jgi:hypothetical protein
MAQIVFMCMLCQPEYPEVNKAVRTAMSTRKDISISHGVCQRHYTEMAKKAGKSDEEIEASMIRLGAAKCPDLRAHPELVKQYSQGVFVPEDLNPPPAEVKEIIQKRAGIIKS